MPDADAILRHLVQVALMGDQGAIQALVTLDPDFGPRVGRAAAKLAEIRAETEAEALAAPQEERFRIIRVAVEGAMLELLDGSGNA